MTFFRSLCRWDSKLSDAGRRITTQNTFRRFGNKIRINCWCPPRSASTSLMYSFAQRSDTLVVDEPFYATRLVKTGDSRPYLEQLLKDQSSDGNEVVETVIMGTQTDKRVIYFKHMAKDIGLVSMDFAEQSECENILLLRHPRDVVASYVESIDQDTRIREVSVDDTGFVELKMLYDKLVAAGKRPIVIDNQKLLERPEGTLRALCKELGLHFEKEMLRWKKGGRPEDGCWAYFWYHHTHASTGFESRRGLYPKASKPLLSKHLPVVQDCMPAYETLKKAALKPDPVLPDDRNADIWVWVNGLKKRKDAQVSVFDSSVQGGDAVWEGLRIYEGKVFALEDHLKRMQDSAKAMMFEDVPSNDEIKQAIFETLNANGMFDESHIRLTLTRGEKVSSGMSPMMNQSGCILIVLAEWKKPIYNNDAGIRLVTSSIRRNGPSTVDSKIHHCNLINNILAKIEANLAGRDDALMLDAMGFLSETNATNVFIIREGLMLTPHADYCLPGITRKKTIALAMENGIDVVERNISLTEAQTCDEMFTTGTMGELTPVVELDGRKIGEGDIGPVTRMLQERYAKLPKDEFDKAMGSVVIPRMQKYT